MPIDYNFNLVCIDCFYISSYNVYVVRWIFGVGYIVVGCWRGYRDHLRHQCWIHNCLFLLRIGLGPNFGYSIYKRTIYGFNLRCLPRHEKKNSFASFVCPCIFHGSPSNALHITSHNISSVWELSCAKQDRRSISPTSCLKASSSDLAPCLNCWYVCYLSFRLHLVLSVSRW